MINKTFLLSLLFYVKICFQNHRKCLGQVYAQDARPESVKLVLESKEVEAWNVATHLNFCS